MSMRKTLAAFLLMTSISVASLADMPALRGYEMDTEPAYQYVTFGTYPHGKEGEIAPVVWRVLGRGTPQHGDVVDQANTPSRKEVLPVNGDDLTGENQDVFLLMTEYIIDLVMFHGEKDVMDHPLDYENSLMYTTLNTEVIDRLFTKEEQAVLVEMPERGLLSLPSRKGELHRTDYGFVNQDFVKWDVRATTGTPYAIANGLRRIKKRSWYFTTDWRRYGYRWIVGDDGHISVSGIDRKGGIRPVCYVHTDMLDCAGGDGTLENPYQLIVKSSAQTAATE